MFVHRSSSLEELVDHLHGVVSGQGLALLERETILIQSAGMERYLSRELSRRSGIAANVEFPFPRSFFHRVLDAALGVDERAAAFDRASLTWVLFANLDKHLLGESPLFDRVRNYLSGDEDKSKRLLLAERLAHLFDQYVTYRPRMVLGWEEGDAPDDFQAILWRQLVEQLGPAHFAARCNTFINETPDETLRAALPSRLSLMGGPGLPPLFLQMLARIGKVVPCHVFSFSVCQEYFADAHPLNEPLPDVGEGLHPLLVSLGKVGADYQHLLEMIGEYQEGPAKFRVVTPKTVLGGLQQSLIEGRREPKDAAAIRSELLKTLESDHSITVDSCHSPLREVETLHDRLLGWFAADPTLRPEDVVVLAPNIEEYSPLISAVFSARAGERPQIPFRIADRSEKFTNAAARAFLLSFSVLRGRVKASEVLDLLQLSPVRGRYGIESADLERIGRWVADSGVRWGIDGEHRVEFGLPDEDMNTWRFGLRRLLLGYALPDDGAQLWQDVVPLDGVAVGDLELVGRLCDFCENLFSLRQRLVQAGAAGLTPSGWGLYLSDLMDAVLGEPPMNAEAAEETWDAGAVRSVVLDMVERADASLTWAGADRAEQRLGVRSISHLLASDLDASRPSTDFLAGGVTFCALLPLRTIPFRAVCVLGLNQGEFPRTDAHHQLDLMAADPKRGDRSLRADDRYLFLEVILAARERLSLSYVGRSVQDNTAKPPSVVVTELSAVVDEMLKRGTDAPSFMAPTEHPLQPFHPDYFSEGTADGAAAPGSLSYDRGAYLAACALLAEPRDPVPFFVEMDVEGDHQATSLRETELSLDDVVRFWKDPTKAFFAARGVRIADEIVDVEDREPVVETPLSRYSVGDRLLGQKLRGEPVREDLEVRRGELPVGQGGRVLLENVSEVAADIYRATASFRADAAPRHEAVSLGWDGVEMDPTWGVLAERTGPLVLTGSLDGIYPEVRLETSYGQLNPNRKIALWVRHLAACASGLQLKRSVIVLRAPQKSADTVETFVLGAVEPAQAKVLLGRLCALAVLGLSQPLRFFPTASGTYFDFLAAPPKKIPEEDIVFEAFEAARKSLFPGHTSYSPDAAVAELYRGTDPLGCLDSSEQLTVDIDDLAELPFARLAETVFHPMSQATEAQS